MSRAPKGSGCPTIEWTLITAHHDELVLEVRNRAVQDAVTRAQQYADALGLGAIQPVAVADAGMLADTSRICGVQGPHLRAVGRVRERRA